MLTSSRASQGIYGISKTVTFLYLGGVIALKSAAATYNILPEFIASFEVAGIVIATLTVSMCIVRGIPVLVDGWEYVKG